MFFSGDPSFRDVSGAAGVMPRARRTRCYRTLADGRMALVRDWRGLFAGARPLGEVVLQTRHDQARLIARTVVPCLQTSGSGHWARDERHHLEINTRAWRRVWGRLAPCDCCGSPGNVEVCNEADLEFLQLCALPGCALGAWADVLESVGVLSRPLRPAAVSLPSRCPALSPEAIPVSRGVDALWPLLMALGDEAVPLRWLLQTQEARHQREFVPLQVTEESGVMTIRAGTTTVQVGWPAVQLLAVNPRMKSWPLFVVGSDERVLLTVMAGADREAAAAWRSALRAAFPQLG